MRLLITMMVAMAVQAAHPAFEVVSVKVNKPGERRQLTLQYLPGGRFSARAVPIPLLVAEAYDTVRLNPSPEFQKLDLSAVDRDLYDIEATAPKDAIPPGSSSKDRDDKIKEMLRTLLADRFKLRVHRELKEQTVYALVIGKNGPKLQSADECADKPTSFFDPNSCHSMADLVKFAQRGARLELPVIDKTGLTGLYSIPSVDWSSILPGPRQPEDPSRPTFIDVLDKLGLKMETQKATVDMLFVDHVEVPTPEN
jgi:uncharacterized protein (TIGR03435 family)